MRSWFLLHMSLCISIHIRACYPATNQHHLTAKSTDPFLIAPVESNLAEAFGDWLSFGFVKPTLRDLFWPNQKLSGKQEVYTVCVCVRACVFVYVWLCEVAVYTHFLYAEIN